MAHGEKKDARCGVFMRRKVKKLRGCLRLKNHAKVGLDGVDYHGKVFVKRVFYSCNRPECPSCGIGGWAVREASRAEARLKYASDKLNMKSEHIIVSPKQDLDVSFEKLKKMALRAMLVRGIVGGLWIYHHFRYHRKDETYVGEHAHYFKAPHFHILGFIKGGYGNCRSCVYQKNKTFAKCREGGCNGFEAVTRRAYEKDGFIVKVKGERKTVGGTVWYQLSHASLRRGAKKHVVVNWFGICGRNKLKIRKGLLPQKENLCKICGEPLYDVEFLGDYAKLLTFMSPFGDGHGFVLDAKDKNGKWLWRAVVKRKVIDDADKVENG